MPVIGKTTTNHSMNRQTHNGIIQCHIGVGDMTTIHNLDKKATPWIHTILINVV